MDVALFINITLDVKYHQVGLAAVRIGPFHSTSRYQINVNIPLFLFSWDPHSVHTAQPSCPSVLRIHDVPMVATFSLNIADPPEPLPLSAITPDLVGLPTLRHTGGNVVRLAVCCVVDERELRLAKTGPGLFQLTPFPRGARPPVRNLMTRQEHTKRFYKLFFHGEEPFLPRSADGKITLAVHGDAPRQGRLGRQPSDGMIPKLQLVDSAAAEAHQRDK